GVDPARVAGHSLGEYTALTAAGVLSFSDGVKLVTERGEAMQVAAAERAGTMAAIVALDDDEVAVACARTDGDVWVANHNAPGQVVISGAPEAIEAAGQHAKELGARRILPLEVGGAFHTPFMGSARDRVRKALAKADLRDAELPVLANVDARPHTSAADWENLLAAQLCSPVRWRHILQALGDEGVDLLVELGPGTALTGMAKRTVEGVTTLAVNVPDDLDELLSTMHEPRLAEAAVEHGEHLFVTERLVVSPGAGVFRPEPGVGPGSPVEPGTLVGHVGDLEVRSAFAGQLVDVLAVDGERLATSEPVAWLRSA
ncbi:MAG TPA: ACP S-malonyltransferase, partial [Acidimicrobiales bacterium]|nr:ACP S-malonyltransferase [Acidimicrobiales bacterium]